MSTRSIHVGKKEVPIFNLSLRNFHLTSHDPICFKTFESPGRDKVSVLSHVPLDTWNVFVQQCKHRGWSYRLWLHGLMWSSSGVVDMPSRETTIKSLAATVASISNLYDRREVARGVQNVPFLCRANSSDPPEERIAKSNLGISYGQSYANVVASVTFSAWAVSTFTRHSASAYAYRSIH